MGLLLLFPQGSPTGDRFVVAETATATAAALAVAQVVFPCTVVAGVATATAAGRQPTTAIVTFVPILPETVYSWRNLLRDSFLPGSFPAERRDRVVQPWQQPERPPPVR